MVGTVAWGNQALDRESTQVMKVAKCENYKKAVGLADVAAIADRWGLVTVLGLPYWFGLYLQRWFSNSLR